MLNDPHYIEAKRSSQKEKHKTPSRTEIINYLLSLTGRSTSYLEIGVRNPAHNFDHINADDKHSVDPGLEYRDNPVKFKMTSDLFFKKLSQGQVLSPNMKFDVIFIDGLHLAEQVDRDITNAFNFLNKDGFVVIHDCNPPSHWHARELFDYRSSPATGEWNGTTWKAFLKWRSNPEVYSCCIDTDWGIGVLSKLHPIGKSIAPVNEFFEYADLDQNRKEYLNLISFDHFQKLFPQK